jgi:hypothetical protein
VDLQAIDVGLTYRNSSNLLKGPFFWRDPWSANGSPIREAHANLIASSCTAYAPDTCATAAFLSSRSRCWPHPSIARFFFHVT